MSRAVFLAVMMGLSATLCAQPADTTDRSWEFQYPRQIVNLIKGRFEWKSGGALIFAARSDDDAARGNGIKEPTAVRYGGKWHLFATLRNERPTHQIVYISFADWGDANKGQREILKLDENHAASEVDEDERFAVRPILGRVGLDRGQRHDGDPQRWTSGPVPGSCEQSNLALPFCHALVFDAHIVRGVHGCRAHRASGPVLT